MKKLIYIFSFILVLGVGFSLIPAQKVYSIEPVCVNNPYYTVTGTVTYIYGGGVTKPASGAVVKAKRTCNGIVYKTVVNTSGNYSLNLQGSHYRISVSDKDKNEFYPKVVDTFLKSNLYGVNFQAPIGPQVQPLLTSTPIPTPTPSPRAR